MTDLQVKPRCPHTERTFSRESDLSENYLEAAESPDLSFDLWS